ncbi:MAG: helix-turn-helix domain-containing protein [Armatimonadota bacterium]
MENRLEEQAEGEQEDRRARGAREMGDRIGQARREAGFRTAQNFSEALDVSVWTVRSWESGKSQPRYDMLATISELCGRPKAWFLGEGAVHDRLDRAMGELMARRQSRDEEGEDEPGVYGIPARNRVAEEELQALSSDARDWGVLIRITSPVPPVACEEIAALHLALANLVARERQQ